jgi:serine/threonine-protein kinase
VAQVRHQLTRGVVADPVLVASLNPSLPSQHDTKVLPANQIDTSQIDTAVVDADPDSLTAPLPPATTEDTPRLPDRVESDRRPVKPLVTISQHPTHIRRRRGLIALALLILIGLIGGGVTFWWLRWGRWTDQPVLTGLTQVEAVSQLTQAELLYELRQEYSEEVPAGRVIRSDPGDGQAVLKDGTVVIYLSLGPERYDMPELLGLTLEQANQQIMISHLTLGQVDEVFSDEVPLGQVVSASEKVGTPLKPATTINLAISKGPEPIPISDQAGQPREAAEAALSQAGFQVSVTEEHSKSVPAGSVIRQEPASGTGKRGDTITLVISKGPVMVAVPDVRGKDRASATADLKGAGFQVEIKYAVSSAVAFGMALATDPKAGVLAAEGSTVVLTLV